MIRAKQEFGEFDYPGMYGYQTFEDWEARCIQWIDMGVGLTISNPPYRSYLAMTTEELLEHDKTTANIGSREDPQDIEARGEVEFGKDRENDTYLMEMLGEFEW